MTTDRAVKLGKRVAAAALAGVTLDEATKTMLQRRIESQGADLLLSIDWRVLPEDQTGAADDELFSGQMKLL